jgi:hypothetical protein
MNSPSALCIVPNSCPIIAQVMSNPTDHTFSELLKRFRVHSGLTQEQLATQLRVDRKTIGN